MVYYVQLVLCSYHIIFTFVALPSSCKWFKCADGLQLWSQSQVYFCVQSCVCVRVTAVVMHLIWQNIWVNSTAWWQLITIINCLSNHWTYIRVSITRLLVLMWKCHKHIMLVCVFVGLLLTSTSAFKQQTNKHTINTL